MLFSNNYETNLKQAGEKALAAAQLPAGPQRTQELHDAMMAAHRVHEKMQYYGESATRGTGYAADCLEFVWLTSKEHPDHPSLESLIRSASRICTDFAPNIPPRVHARALNEATDAAQRARTIIRSRVPADVLPMTAAAQRAAEDAAARASKT